MDGVFKLGTQPNRFGYQFLIRFAVSIFIIGTLYSSTAVALERQVPGFVGTDFIVSPDGEAVYTVPVELPPGINGLLPNIALKYLSSKGNGLIGRGWGLTGIGEIQRCGRSLAQDGAKGAVNLDSNDRFCLNGNRLIVTQGGYGAANSEYRQEIDQSIKVLATGFNAGAPDSFIAYSPDGRSYEYGRTEDSKIEAQHADAVRVWALNKVSDSSGNYFTIEYDEDREHGEFRPLSIQFTGNDNVGQAPDNQLLFEYAPRADPVFSCLRGNLIQSSKTLARMVAYAGLTQTRIYKLEYDKPEGESKRISPDACTASDLAAIRESGESAYQQLLDKQYKEEQLDWQLKEALDNQNADLIEKLGSIDAEYRELLLSELEKLSNEKSLIHQLYTESLADLDGYTDTEIGVLKDGLEQQLAEKTQTREQDEIELNARYENQIDALTLYKENVKNQATNSLANSMSWFNEKLTEFRNNSTNHQAYSSHKEIIERNTGSELIFHDRIHLDVVNRASTLYKISRHFRDKAAQHRNPSDFSIGDTFNCEIGFLDQNLCVDPAILPEITGSDAESLATTYETQATALEQGALTFYLTAQSLSELKDWVITATQSYPVYLGYAGRVNLAYERHMQDLYTFYTEIWNRKVHDISLRIQGAENDRKEALLDIELDIQALQDTISSLDIDGLQQVYERKTAQISEQVDALNALLNDSSSQTSVQEQIELEVDQIEIRQRLLGYDHSNRNAQFQNQLDLLLNNSGTTSITNQPGAGGSMIGESRLTSIKVCAGDGSCLAPLSFDWLTDTSGWEAGRTELPFGPENYAAGAVESSEETDELSADSSADVSKTSQILGGDSSSAIDSSAINRKVGELTRQISESGVLEDVNGDGLPDWIVAMRDIEGFEYRATWLNNGSGWDFSYDYTLPVPISESSGLKLGEFIDINGDGFIDWLGGARNALGEETHSAYLNTQAGWSLNESYNFPGLVFQETSDGYSKTGEFIRLGTDQAISWIGVTRDKMGQIQRSFYTLDPASGWLAVENDFPGIVYQQDSEGRWKGGGQFIDLDRDGLKDWVSSSYSIEEPSRVWLNQPSGWQGEDVYAAYSDYSVAVGQNIRLFDLTADGFPELITAPDSGLGMEGSVYQNTGSGWALAEDLTLPAALQNQDGETLADLIDINVDGLSDLLVANNDQESSEHRTTFVNEGVNWLPSYDSQFPRSVRIQEPDLQGAYRWRELGAFSDLNADGQVDWLNKNDVWTANSDGASIGLDQGKWFQMPAYRLPSMERSWLAGLAKNILSGQPGDNAVDKNLLSQISGRPVNLDHAEQLVESGNALGIDDDSLLLNGSEGLGGNHSGRFVDLNNDGRMDWVVSTRFEPGAGVQTVWLQSASGWERSAKFVPPTFLHDSEALGFSQILDINADAKPDWVESYIDIEGVLHESIWLNDGQEWRKDETAHLPMPLRAVLSGNTLQPLAVLVDVNGDALLDLVPANNVKSLCIQCTEFTNEVQLAEYLDLGRAPVWNASKGHLLPTSFTTSSRLTVASQGIFADINQDGLVDWLVNSGGKTTVWLNQESAWVFDEIYTPPTPLFDQNGNLLVSLVDINSDGLSDWIVSYRQPGGREERSSWLNTGKGWRLDEGYTLPGALNQIGQGALAYLTDINIDGRIDFVQHYQDEFGFTEKSVWLNTGLGWSKSGAIQVPPLMASIDEGGSLEVKGIIADIDGDHRGDLVQQAIEIGGAMPLFRIRKAEGFVSSRVEAFSKGTFTTQVRYGRGVQPDNVSRLSNSVYPEIDASGTVTVVQSYQIIKESQLLADKAYQYGGKKFSLTGRGDLGFRWVEENDAVSNLLSRTEYRQDFPFVRMPERIDILQQNGALLSRISNEEFTHTTSNTGVFQPKVKRSLTHSYDLAGQLVFAETVNIIQIDEYGYPLSSQTTREQANGDKVEALSNLSYHHDLGRWILGRVSSASIDKQSYSAAGNDSQSSSTQFTYDTAGRVNSSVKNGVATTYKYDAYGNMVEQRKTANGLPTLIEAANFGDNGKFLSSKTGVAGQRSEFSYSNENGKITSILSPENKLTRYEYDGWFRKVREYLPNGDTRHWKLLYCPEGDGTEVCPGNAGYFSMLLDDKNESPEIVYYDELGREVRRAIAGVGGKMVYLDTIYDQHGRVASRTSPYFKGDDSPSIAVFSYDVLGRKTMQTRFGGGETHWEYDGLKVTEIDPRGNATQTTSDLNGLPVKIVDSKGGVTRYAYDALSQLIQTTDAHGNISTVEYDSEGNKRFINDLNKGRIEFQYNGYGWPIRQINPDGSVVEYRYDAYGRKQSRSEPEGITTWEYVDNSSDPGRLSKVTGYDGFTRQFTYDNQGRMDSETQILPDGKEYMKNLTYWGDSGSIQTILYPNGVSVRHKYNELGYFTEVLKGGVETYKQYEQKFLLAKNHYDIARDKWNDGDAFDGRINKWKSRKIAALANSKQKLDEARSWADKANKIIGSLKNLAARVHALKEKIRSFKSYTSADGRSVRGAFSSEPAYLSNVNNYRNCLEEVERNAAGGKGERSLSICANYEVAAKQAIFDAISRYENQAIELVNRQAQLKAKMVGYGKKADSAATSASSYMKDANAAAASEFEFRQLKFNLYAEGNAQAELANGFKNEADELYASYENEIKQAYWQRVEMSAANQALEVRYGNGLSTAYQYNNDGGMVSTITTLLDIETVLDTRYRYDSVGNLLARDDEFSGSSENFNYDELNRLVRASYHNVTGATALQSVEYDLIGNITYKSGVGGYLYGSAKPHLVTSIDGHSLSYDSIGNLTQGNGVEIGYASFGKPVRLEKPGELLAFSEFKYSPERQVYYEKSAYEGENGAAGGVETWKLFGGEYIIRRDGIRNTVTVNLSNGQSVVATIELEEDMSALDATGLHRVRYFHHDHLGSVIAVSDEQGKIINRQHYDAWGQPIDGATLTGSQPGFTGHQFIGGLDLVHMNGRIYDPVIGRFLSADLFVPDFTNPQSLNRYAYVYNNPLRYIDPDGYRPTIFELEVNERVNIALASISIGKHLDTKTFYNIRHLQLTNPTAVRAVLKQMGIKQSLWTAEVESLVDGAWQNREAIKQVQKQRKKARYLAIARFALAAYSAGASEGWQVVATQAVANASISYIATGDADTALRSLAVSLVTYNIVGESALNLADAGTSQIASYIARSGLAQGLGEVILGGEFEDGFFAGIVQAGLNVTSQYFDLDDGYASAVLWGALEGGILAEVYGGRFQDGAQAGALRSGFRVLGENQLGSSFSPGNPNRLDFGEIGLALSFAIDGDTDGALISLAGFAGSVVGQEIVRNQQIEAIQQQYGISWEDAENEYEVGIFLQTIPAEYLALVEKYGGIQNIPNAVLDDFYFEMAQFMYAHGISAAGNTETPVLSLTASGAIFGSEINGISLEILKNGARAVIGSLNSSISVGILVTLYSAPIGGDLTILHFVGDPSLSIKIRGDEIVGTIYRSSVNGESIQVGEVITDGFEIVSFSFVSIAEVPAFLAIPGFQLGSELEEIPGSPNISGDIQTLEGLLPPEISSGLVEVFPSVDEQGPLVMVTPYNDPDLSWYLTFSNGNVRTFGGGHFTSSGETVLGHYGDPLGGGEYKQFAIARGASYFDLGKDWNEIDGWVANVLFLDVIAFKGDKIILSENRYNIRENSYLVDEINYLIETHSYKWHDDWSLVKNE